MTFECCLVSFTFTLVLVFELLSVCWSCCDVMWPVGITMCHIFSRTPNKLFVVMYMCFSRTPNKLFAVMYMLHMVVVILILSTLLWLSMLTIIFPGVVEVTTSWGRARQWHGPREVAKRLVLGTCFITWCSRLRSPLHEGSIYLVS
jgi:hypothetical protein